MVATRNIIVMVKIAIVRITRIITLTGRYHSAFVLVMTPK